MTVDENLDMGAYTQPASTIAANKEKVFTLFPRLKERRKQLAGTMSGGEQQMLAMGRALMSNASMLMLDEPSMGLSPLLVQEIFDIIRDIHKEGMTILLVEQNAQMALSVADRAYVLETGRVVMDGTGAELLTDKQAARLRTLFGAEEHVEVEATWGIYQRMIAAYREPDRTRGRALMTRLIASVSHGVPAALSEVITLGRTLKKRADDVLAYFDRPGTSNGPTEALNGRLEHLRGSALGFRNLTNYIARSLLETGGFRPRLHPRL